MAKSAIQAFEDANLRDMEQIFTKWAAAAPRIDLVAKRLLKNKPLTPHHKHMILTAAKLATEKNDNPYHGNRHFLEVFCFSYTLGLNALQNSDIDQDDFARLLTAALIHDYKHDGKNNGAGENHKQFRLEEQSFTLAEPALKEAGATEQDLKIIKLLVLATDVSSPSPDTVGPAGSLKNFLKAPKANPDLLHPALRELYNEDKIDLAMMMHDSDLGSGSCLSYRFSMEAGTLLAKEHGWPTEPENIIKGQRFFLEKICEREVFSKAGKRCLQEGQNHILKAFGITPLHEEPSAP